MKIHSLLFWAVLSSLFSPIYGKGPRGAAERMLQYFAYLAEEITVPTGGLRIIAPGCFGSRVNNRCTFNEFAQYVWGPEKGKPDNPPLVTAWDDAKDITEESISSTYNTIVKWRSPSGDVITGEVKANRVLSGAADWYDMISRVAGPIGDLANLDLSDDPRAGLAQKLINYGQRTATLVHEFRWQDMEKYRPTVIARLLGVDPNDLRYRAGPNTEGMLGNWQEIDAMNTVADLQEAGRANAETEFANAVTTYETYTAKSAAHWAAVTSADNARRLSGCHV